MIIEIKEVKKNGCIKYFYTYKLNNKISQRICKNCSTKEEAEFYVRNLKFLNTDEYLIRNIAEDMYISGGSHLKRLKSFGKEICEETRRDKRHYIELIIENFGNKYLDKLSVREIEIYLLNDSVHSGSWKNSYLDTLGSIYDETIWKCTKPISKPKFQRFSRNSRKPDILTTKEIEIFFNKLNWINNFNEYLLFYCMLSFGLRLGEARALKVNQFLFDEHLLVINGFCKRDVARTRTNYNKKGNDDNQKLRVAPMSNSSATIMQRFISENRLSENDYIFTREGRPYRQEFLEELFHKKIVELDLYDSQKKLVPHSLRFTYVTRMRRECNADTVKTIVGHTTVKMTDYYTKSNIEELAKMISGSEKAVNNLFV